MRDPIEVLLLTLLVAWAGILLLVHGMQQGHAVLTVAGVGCCAIAIATYFVLREKAHGKRD